MAMALQTDVRSMPSKPAIASVAADIARLADNARSGRLAFFKPKRMFPGDDADWQRKFDLYLKQNWTRDDELRARYRAEEDVVDWPPAPPEFWPLKPLA